MVGMKDGRPGIHKRFQSPQVVIVERVGFALEAVEELPDLGRSDSEAALFIETLPATLWTHRILGHRKVPATFGTRQRAQVCAQLCRIFTTVAGAVKELGLFKKKWKMSAQFSHKSIDHVLLLSGASDVGVFRPE